MSWTYEQKTGRLLSPNGAYVGICYAGGDCGIHPEGINNPDMQNVHNIGPLPQGLYTMGTAYDHPRLGKFVIPLTPDPANEMFGRSGFFCHGDRVDAIGQQAASDGCIIAARPMRSLLDSSPDRQIQVVHG